MIRKKLIYFLMAALLVLMVGCGSPPAEEPTSAPDTTTSETNDESTESTDSESEDTSSDEDESGEEETSSDDEGTEAESQTSSSEGGSFTLTYNDRALAIMNTGGSDLNIAGLSFVGSSDDEGDTFSDSALGASLGRNECLAMLTGRLTGQDLPEDWACDPVRETSLVTDVLFWRADSAEDETFTIMNGDEVVGTCDTAGRAVNRLEDITCSVDW